MTKLADSLQDKVITLGPADEQFPLAEYLRKLYQVVHTDPATGETYAPSFDNSADANAFANTVGGEVVVVEVTSTPKSSFWSLWEDYKKDMQAQGVYVTKQDGQFVVTDTKPTKGSVLKSKGYGAGSSEREERYSVFAGNVKFAY